MKVEYSRQFLKESFRLSGKYKKSLQRIIAEVKSAEDIPQIPNCIKLVSYQNYFRIRMGNYRLILLYQEAERTIFFTLLLSREEVYKRLRDGLRNKG